MVLKCELWSLNWEKNDYVIMPEDYVNLKKKKIFWMKFEDWIWMKMWIWVNLSERWIESKVNLKMGCDYCIEKKLK